MALLDILRFSVDQVNRATAMFREYTVTLVQESATLSATPVRLGTTGATYTVTPVFTLTPAIPVDFNPNPADPSWQGGGLIEQNQGTNTMTLAVIGSVAQAYNTGIATGGYSDVQLVPPAVNPTSRYVYVINGPGLPTLAQYGGVPFKPVWLWAPDAQTWKLTVIRTETFKSP